MNRIRSSTFLLMTCASLLSTAAHAGVLRCTDAAGRTLYTDAKCPQDMRAVEAAVSQACATEECERQRERDVLAAKERARAEKEELATLTAERHRQEIEDRRIDEARYEASLQSAALAAPMPAGELVYPAYPVVGYPVRCGRHCLQPRPRHHGTIAGFEVRKGSTHARVAGNEPRSALRATVARAGVTVDGTSPHPR